LLALVALLAPPEPVRIVILGDSITRGDRAGVTAEDTNASRVQAALGKEKVSAVVVNRGIGGERTDQALKRLDRDVLALKPHIVAIMYGHNDSHVDRGRKDQPISTEEYEKNLRRIVAAVRKAGARPVLMTPPCYNRKARQGGLPEESPNIRLEKCVLATRRVARELKVPLVDHWEHWVRQRERPEDVTGWTTDGYHANARGHAEMTAVILPVLRKALAEGK
jgi:lysophospholipase L1-like esterase